MNKKEGKKGKKGRKRILLSIILICYIIVALLIIGVFITMSYLDSIPSDFKIELNEYFETDKLPIYDINGKIEYYDLSEHFYELGNYSLLNANFTIKVTGQYQKVLIDTYSFDLVYPNSTYIHAELYADQSYMGYNKKDGEELIRFIPRNIHLKPGESFTGAVVFPMYEFLKEDPIAISYGHKLTFEL